MSLIRPLRCLLLMAGCPSPPDDSDDGTDATTEVGTDTDDGTDTDVWTDTDVGTDAPDPCEDVSCTNGECVADGTEATCDWDAGWQGDDCDAEVDECAATPCQSDAVCIDQLAAFTCVCADGFEGEVCDVNIDECADSPCDQGDCDDGLRE